MREVRVTWSIKTWLDVPEDATWEDIHKLIEKTNFAKRLRATQGKAHLPGAEQVMEDGFDIIVTTPDGGEKAEAITKQLIAESAVRMAAQQAEWDRLD